MRFEELMILLWEAFKCCIICNYKYISVKFYEYWKYMLLPINIIWFFYNNGSVLIFTYFKIWKSFIVIKMLDQKCLQTAFKNQFPYSYFYLRLLKSDTNVNLSNNWQMHTMLPLFVHNRDLYKGLSCDAIAGKITYSEALS